MINSIKSSFVHLDIVEDILNKRFSIGCASSLENSVKFLQLTVKRFFVLEKLRPFSDLRNIFNLQRRLLHGCSVHRATADILALPCPDVRATPTNSHEILFPTWLRRGLMPHSTRPRSKVIGKREIWKFLNSDCDSKRKFFSKF